MRMKKNRWFQILYPIAVYYLFYNLLYTLLRLLFSGLGLPSLLWLGLASLGTVPVMYHIYKTLPIVRETAAIQWKKLPEELLGIFAIVAAGLLFNLILSHTPLIGWSKGYIEANRTLYDGGFAVKLFVNGMAIPILEELVYRGIVLGQLRLWMSRGAAIAISAFCFGIMHFNIVQFCYGFVVGLVIGFVYDRTSRLWVVMAAHGLTNILALVLSA